MTEQAWRASNKVKDHFHVTLSGNNSQWECKWCAGKFLGSSTRAYTHLTGQQSGRSRKGTAQCPAISEDVRRRLVAAKTQANAEKESRKRSADVSVNQLERDQAFERVNVSVSGGLQTTGASVSMCSAAGCKFRIHAQVPQLQTSFPWLQVVQMLQNANTQLVHKKFAAFVYEEGLPLRVCKSLALREFIEALQRLPRGVKYTPPAYNTLRTTLLQEAKQDGAQDVPGRG
jgi:hypothetical protein